MSKFDLMSKSQRFSSSHSHHAQQLNKYSMQISYLQYYNNDVDTTTQLIEIKKKKKRKKIVQMKN